MEFSWFTRVIARVVLAAYVTQIFAPVVYACELDARPERLWGHGLREPSPPREKGLQSSFQQALKLKPRIELLNPTSSLSNFVLDHEQARLQAESFQYRLKVKTKGILSEDIKIKLSRRTKGTDKSFEDLYTSLIHQGTLVPLTSQDNLHANDVLMNLLKGASVYRASHLKDTAGFGWIIPGLATLGITSEGGVVLKQDHSSTLLSHYDLVLKTSQNLSLDYLKVASLTLDAPTTQIPVTGSVSVNQLHIPNASQMVTNEGGLHLKKVTGKGSLISHALLKLEGTKENPAVLGVRHVTNKKKGPKEAKIEGSHVHITSDNFSFLNGEGAEFRVREHLTVDASLHSKVSFTNMGNTYLEKNAIFNRGASNSAFWQAYDMTVNEKPFNNKKLATLKILDRLSALSLSNEGEITYANRVKEGRVTAKNLIKLKTGINMGSIKGEALFLETEQTFRNKGDIFLKTLTGTGVFYNDNLLKFSTPDKKHGSIDVAHFKNGGHTQTNTRAKITGGHLLIAERNQDVSNYDADIFVDRLEIAIQSTTAPLTYFINTGHIESKTFEVDAGPGRYQWDNSGNIKTGHTQLSGDHLIFYNMPTGKLQTGSLTSTASRLDNRGDIQVNGTLYISGSYTSQGSNLTTDNLEIHKGGRFINALKSVVLVKKELKADGCVFQNNGTLKTQGKYSQKSGEFINTGLWEHTGDIVLRETNLKNEKTGTLDWQDGKWDFKLRRYDNYGKWVFDRMICSQQFTIHNHGVLHLKNGAITFQHLINHQNLIFSAGQYTLTGGLQNNNLMSFVENDWAFTDDSTIMTANRLVFKDNGFFLGYASAGEIEVEKTLTYDVQPLPKLIRSNGDVTFSKRHRESRTLADLVKVSAKGKVSFYCPATITTQDYEFGNIGHLELYVDGLFTTHHSFKTLILTLEADGPLSCGASNTMMGIIAATKGSLTVKAHSIDGRFAQIYGAGPTKIQSTSGNILCGSPVQKGADFSKRLGCAHEYNDHTGNVWKYTNVNDVNGAYISSNSTLDIKANSSLILDYGQVFSRSHATFTALQNISAIRSIIQGTGTARWAAPSILFGRAPAETLYIYLVEWYPNQPTTAAKSDRTEVHFTDSVWFDTQNLTNQAATIGSGKSLYILYNGQYVDLSEASKRPPTLKMLNYIGSKGSFHFVPIIEAADKIQINIGDAVITGTMNSPIINIELSGNALFHKGGRAHASIDLSKPLFFNLTKGIQKKVAETGVGRGFLQLTASNEVQTAFPIGTPYMDGTKRIMFVTPENQHLYQIPLDSSRIFNPLGSLSGDFLNLHIQSQLSELIGKVEINGANGNNLKALTAHAHQFTEETGKALVTQEDIQKASLAHSMLLYGLEQVGNMIHQQMILCITPQDINDVAGLSGDKIHIHAGGHLSFQNYEVVAENDLDLFAKGELSVLTVLNRLFGENGYQDVIDGPTTKIISKKGNVKAIGKNGFQMRGATLRGLYRVVAGSTEGNTSIENVLLEKAVIKEEKEDGGPFGDDKVTTTTEITTTSQPSFIESVKAVVEVLCGNKEKTTITGSHIKALQAIKFTGGKVETNASAGINRFTQNTQEEGMFSSKESISSQESATLYATLLEALEIYGNTEQATYRGTDFIADVFYDNTKDGASFGPTVATLKYFQQMVSESALAKSDVGCEGWREVMQPCRFAIKKIVRDIDKGEIKLESVDWDKDRTEIIGKFAETVYELKRHHREWAIHEQLIPNEALVVVALAVGFATQGWGASLISKLSSTMFGTVNVAATATTAATIGPAIKLSALGIAVANAGVSALCSHIATSGLRTGDLSQVAKDLTSAEFIRSLGISMLSAGLCQHIGAALKIDMNPSLKEVLTEGKIKPVFTDFLQTQALKSAVNTGLKVAVGGQPGSEALATAARDVALNSVAAWASYKVGDAGFLGKMTPDEQDLAHTGIGALFGVVAHPDKPLEGALTGGLNAFAAARASKIMFGSREEIKAQAEEELHQQGRPVTKESLEMAMNDLLHQKTALITLLSASATAAITRDPGLTSTGIFTATNVVENNCIPSMTKSLMVAQYHQSNSGEGDQPFWQDVFSDPHDLYYQKALETAFPEEEPSKIRAVVRRIKQLRRDYPTVAEYVDQGLYGIATGLQYSAYASGGLLGFAAGELVNPVVGGYYGASLGLSMAKAAESFLGEAFKYGYTKASNWYAGEGNSWRQMDRRLVFQELTTEVLPFLALMGLKGVRISQSHVLLQSKSVYSFRSQIFDKKITWTSPVGTQQTYKVYQRNDIDWDMVRTVGRDQYRGLSNRDAALKYGAAPQLNDGNFATLHHLGQDVRGGLVEASRRYHGVGKYGQDSLHSQYGKNKPHPEFPVDHKIFTKEHAEYWKWRATK